MRAAKRQTGKELEQRRQAMRQLTNKELEQATGGAKPVVTGREHTS